jgi:hypothetical protein
MFPKRKYKNCRNWPKHMLIDTYVVTQQMHTDKIRLATYNIYVHLHGSVAFATTIIVF